MWGSEGKDEGQFIENHGIVVDSEGNVYVVDTEMLEYKNLIAKVTLSPCGDRLDVRIINF